MAFDLAHEFGHILNGDIGDDDVLMDEEITQGGGCDANEVRANRTGMIVLTGEPDPVYSKGFPFFETVATWASRVGNKFAVNPGVVAQNLAFHTKKWGLGNGACKQLEADADPIVTIRKMMLLEIDTDRISDDEAQFLLRTAGEGLVDAVPARH